jgi:hypothetical protein
MATQIVASAVFASRAVSGNESIEEICIRTIVSLGGGIYLGVSDWLVWFVSPQTKSTLALPIAELSADAVRRHIEKSNARFEVSR